MNRYASRKRTIARWLVILLLAALLLLPAGTPVALAQSVPAPCLNDAGQPVLPAEIMGAWALILNFNHAPSTTTTIACMVMTSAVQPQKISHTFVTCTIVNNSSNVQVGGGVAPFDGQFTITCPNGPPVPGYGPLYNAFVIHGRAQFPTLTTTASFKLVEHPHAEFTVAVNTSGNATLTSRYGPYTYKTADSITNVTTAPVFFASVVANGQGRHQVAQNNSYFTTPVDQFPFNFSQPITIGRSQQPWTLHELVIDPPPPRGGFSG
ncbi:MAG: hypothetical protein DYG89_33510 [Caldilinea sp. CFX5]|nr:hypothetical protein [Caldilinea sp. CFX5]